jgi:hypothetical protein
MAADFVERRNGRRHFGVIQKRRAVGCVVSDNCTADAGRYKSAGMTLCTASGALPAHQYVHVDTTFMTGPARIGDDSADQMPRFVPAVWFGLHSHPGRAWGCHVMLECGAVYRGLPPHAIAFSAAPEPLWGITDAQRWDCYGWQFSLLRYTYLRGLECRLRDGTLGKYLFTAVPIDDGFSNEPAQSKEFMFIRTAHDRLAIMPTNDVLFIDRSFTDAEPEWPKHLRRLERTWSSEGVAP